MRNNASWLDQAEISFAVVQRDLVSPNGSFDTSAIAERLAAFEQGYNAVAQPFDWCFTKGDLNDVLDDRIAVHGALVPARAVDVGQVKPAGTVESVLW